MLLFRVGGIPLDGAGLAFEPVGDDDFVFFRGRSGEDVGALEGLLKIAEDVVDDEDALFGGGGACYVWGCVSLA